MAEGDVELKVKPVERDGETLVLTYEVHNRRAQALWLLDGLFDTAPSGHVTLAPDKAYVDVDGSRVVVSRMLLAVPDDVLVESPEVPAATRVEAGKTVSRRVVLALPVREALPYASRPGETLPLDAVRELRLRVGYLVDSPELTLHETTDTEGVAYRYPSYGRAVQGQQVLESGPLTLPK
ncbi:hypothetical protein [Pyxidicoccus trucidator]|uniref:hypothetical protein n=1 Tax=Pyxidicoccus trucidator TaxID=2709662 RepID=UPI001F079021|nr:hypothetical protein [Pyxidicoccus trucidator]